MAGRFSVGFNTAGGFTAYPTVSSHVNADDLDLRNQGPQGIMAVLALGAGFFPPKVASALPLDLGAPARFIAPSELLTASTYAARPFPALDRGAGAVFVVPVTPATPATMTLSSATPTSLLTLTTRGWGLTMNGILVRSEAGKVTLLLPTATGTVTEPFSYSTIAQLVSDINERSAICSAAFLAEGTPTTFSNTAMGGATEPAASNSDWNDALNALNGLRVNAIHVATPSSTIQAMLGSYCIAKRSRGFVGSGIKNWVGVTNRQNAITTLKNEAAALNAPRLMHVGLGADGLPGYLTAARRAALSCSVDPSVPITQKALDFQALEAILDIQTEVGGLDGLLFGGISPDVMDPQSPGTFVVGRGLSTWIGDANLYRREHSVLAGVDALQDNLEAALAQFRGGEGTPATIQRAINVTESVLRAATQPNATSRINSYRPTAISARFADTVLQVACRVEPITPINFIDIGVVLERTDITFQASVNLLA